MIPSLPDVFPKIKGAYIVGGSVRDLIMGRSPADYDIVVSMDPEKYANIITCRHNGSVVNIGKSGYRITRVVLDSIMIDIAPLTGMGIEDDLKKRDFTINAMAYDLQSGKIIDCMAGMRDITAKTIRMVSESALKNDPVRLLRAFRLGASLVFDIEPLTLSAIKRNAGKISRTAGERLRTEILKLLQTSRSYPFLLQMADTGLLFKILPELIPLKNCRQNRYHRYDVFDHTLNAFNHLEYMLENIHFYMPKLSKKHSYMDDEHKPLLKFAMLLHDIGKPAARSEDKNAKKIKFHGHESIGAGMAENICRRLRFSIRETAYVVFIIKNHLRPLFLYKAWRDKTTSSKILTRFFMKCRDNIIDLLLHAIADFKGKEEDNGERSQLFEAFAMDVIDLFFMKFRPKIQQAPLITGKDLIKDLGLSPSPLFKTILDITEEARISGTIKTKQEALDLAAKILKKW